LREGPPNGARPLTAREPNHLIMESEGMAPPMPPEAPVSSACSFLGRHPSAMPPCLREAHRARKGGFTTARHTRIVKANDVTEIHSNRRAEPVTPFLLHSHVATLRNALHRSRIPCAIAEAQPDCGWARLIDRCARRLLISSRCTFVRTVLGFDWSRTRWQTRHRRRGRSCSPEMCRAPGCAAGDFQGMRCPVQLCSPAVAPCRSCACSQRSL